MSANDGKASEAIFMANYPGLIFRLRDKRDLMGLNKGKNVAAFANPSDFIVAASDGMRFAEVKSSLNKTSFSLSCFTPSQKAAMYKLHKRGLGDLYRVFIHSLHHNQWYEITGSDVVENLGQGIKSIKWKNLTTLTAWSM